MRQTQAPLISVIVPAYNAAAGLERCIRSLGTQSYSNIEILLSYAASPDHTEDEAIRLAEEMPIVRLLESDGSGVSGARNLALEAAKGEYIAFADADDYAESNYIETLYENIQNNDISICGFDRVKGEESRPESLGHRETYGQDRLIADVLCDNRIGGYLWNKLFRADIIREYGLRFREDLCVGEDMEFLVRYLDYVHIGNYVPDVCYHYCTNEDSALHKMYTTGVSEGTKLNSNLKASRYIARRLSDDDETVRHAASYRLVRTGMWAMFNLLCCGSYDKAVLEDIRTNMKGNLRAFCRSSNSRPVEKASAIGIYISPKGFWHAARLAMRIMPEQMIRGYVNS